MVATRSNGRRRAGVRDPLVPVARAVAAMLAATLLIGLLVPIYTDEVTWRMQLARSPLDGGFDRGLGEQCGPNTILAAPWFLQPLRHIATWTELAFADPRAVRIAGVGGALLWVGLFWVIAGILPKSRRATGRIVGLSLAGLGVLPFLLVWSRPELPLLLLYTMAILVALGGRGATDRASTSVRAWASALALVVIGVLSLGFHPKAVVFLPILLVAAAVSSRGPAGRLARIAAIAALIGFAAVAFRYWSVRLACPGDPILAAMFAKENVAAQLHGQPLPQIAALFADNAPPWPYVLQMTPTPDYMSNWLPAVSIPPALGGLWQMLVLWLWLIALCGLAIMLVSGLIRGLARRRLDGPVLLGCGVVTAVLGWGASQIHKNSYESALVLPLIALTLLLALHALPTAADRALRVAALVLAIAAIASQLLLIGFYAPALARTAATPGRIAGQPFSFTAWGYPQARREMLAAGRLCGIDPATAHDLMIDDLSYFPYMRAARPSHQIAIVGLWHGTIRDPIAYLAARRSSGAVLACAELPADLRARAKAAGGYCCLGPFDGSGR